MLIDIFTSARGFLMFASAGLITAVIGALIAALVYRGKDGERYSPLNHFISELGEVGVSRLAWVFNLGLIITGLCLIPATISLGLMIGSVLSKIALVVGVLSATSLGLVGVFPMNNEKMHGLAAMTYFRMGLVMVILFSSAIAFQRGEAHNLSPWFALAGLPPILSFGGFLLLIGKAAKETDDPLAKEDTPRPKVWTLAVVEWLIFLTMIVWFVVIAWGIPV
jgi:hypothetical membrane protein